MNNQKQAKLRGTVYGIGAASIWGGMYVVSDQVLRVVAPFSLLAIRLLIGAVILAAMLTQSKQLLARTRADMWRLLGVGVVGFGISVGAQFVGTAYSTAINGAVITSASPAFILIFAWLILREPLSLLRVLAIVLASLGVLVVMEILRWEAGQIRFDFSKLNLQSEILLGNLVLLLAAVTWGLYSVLVRLVSKDYPTLTVTTYALVGGFFFSLPVGLINLPNTGEITLGVVLGILYLGVVSTAVAMWLWNRAFALVEASTASLFFFAQPLVGVLLSVVLLSEPLTVSVIAGGFLILLGVLLALRA
jgi:drug/metabolite transporter (DMT)-like permease